MFGVCSQCIQRRDSAVNVLVHKQEFYNIVSISFFVHDCSEYMIRCPVFNRSKSNRLLCVPSLGSVAH